MKPPGPRTQDSGPGPAARRSAATRTLVGTSGYYYREWVGPFYPEGTRTGEMLGHYVTVFPALEINSTYYGLPTPRKMANIARRLPEGYRLVLKTYKTATHGESTRPPGAGGQEGRRRLDDVPACKEAVRQFEAKGVEPVFLAQFPQSFHRDGDALDYVRKLIEAHRPFSVAVEFRHESWLDESVFDALRGEEAIFVNVDEPDLPGLLPPTVEATDASLAYVRLHGRNADGWWGGERYDYFYSQDELAEWLPRVEGLLKASKALLVFFNNCHRASAAQNALDFARLLGIRLSPPQPAQRSLFRKTGADS